MTAHARNAFEASARAAKVAALVRRIDSELRDLTWSPEQIAKFLRAPECNDAWWTGLARQAGLIGKSGRVLVPSAITRDCVAMEYDARASDEASEEPTDRELAELLADEDADYRDALIDDTAREP